MAKCKYISREEALSHPFANGKYDHKNADVNFILGHESYEEWLEYLPAFTEQEIVEPYLVKIRNEILARYNSLIFEEEYQNNMGDGMQECIDVINEEIDNLLSEKEN